MNKLILTLMGALLASFSFGQTPINTGSWPSLVGFWEFDDALNLTTATIGNNLTLSGSDAAVPGPSAGDGATRIGAGSHYVCDHGIAANGGGSFVNEYTLLVDFKVPSLGQYYCFQQTNTSNTNDGEMWINPSGNVGVGDIGYSSYALVPGEWYRLVVSVDLGGQYDYYLDGVNINGGSAGIDGRFSLDPQMLFFGDNNGEDNEFDVALAGLFSTPLSAADVDILGGYGHSITPPVSSSDINPYLQTPTPTSVYVSWHSDDLATTEVRYGTTSGNLNMTETGTYENISGRNWHTVKLENLTPNTEYFYRCVSGSDSSDVFAFESQPDAGTSGEHVRFIILGDSRTNITKATEISDSIVSTLETLYGADWHNEVDLFLHTGDIITNGNVISQYDPQFFLPYAKLTRRLPTMISIGNHEQEANNYYSYMKYEDFTGQGYTSGHPLNEKFFEFYFMNSQFVFLNSNWQLHIPEQIAWLDDVLRESEADTTIDFVFTFNHHPSHSELWPDGNSSYVENDILGLLRFFYKCVQHNYGHSHNYERGVIEMQNSDPNLQHDMRVILQGGGGSALDRWGMYANQTNYSEVHRSIDHWCWTLVDVDVDNRSFDATMYSFGHNDKPLSNVPMDTWYRYLDRPAGQQPVAAGVQYNTSSEPILVGTQYNNSGLDSAMTSHFQVTAFPGFYTAPTIDSKRDFEDLYGDSGAPNYDFTDLNAGIDLTRLNIDQYGLSQGQTYGFRVRYRDHNLRWTEWSDEKLFEIPASVNMNVADFIADDTAGVAPHEVYFSDLSNGSPTSWEWDFDNDGTIDSYDEDPVFTYTQDGDYTVSLTVGYGGGGNASETKNVYIHVGSDAGFEEMPAIVGEMTVAPNPAITDLEVQFTSKEAAMGDITITSIDGKVAAEISAIQINQGENTFNWDLNSDNGSKVAPGTYIIELEMDGYQSQSVKVVVR